MKKSILLGCLFLLLVAFAACNGKKKKSEGTTGIPAIFIINDGLKFSESTLPYKGGLLIANFGVDELNPLNEEGKGYIMKWEDGKIETFIPAGGILSAPKGMAVKDNHLFICDVNKMVVYNLNHPNPVPVILSFPREDLFVNDMIILGNKLYVTVTNSGKIYTLDVTEPANIADEKFEYYAQVPWANGIVTDGSKLYIASYPPDGVTKEENVIYVINNLEQPVAEKLIDWVGQYDGLALSPDHQTLYFTSWVNGEVGKLKLDTKEIELIPVKLDSPLVGPADMSLIDGVLYIPDLPNSRVVTVSI